MLKFVHPGTIKQGYLTKSPPLKKRGLKAWKKRWCIFVVTSNQPFLHYYHSEDEAMHGLPIKRVSLSNCSKVEINLKHSSFRNIFAIHLPERIYYFSAPSQAEMSEWVDALCSHLKLGGSELSSVSRGSATMPLSPPIGSSAAMYDTRQYTGSLPRLPSQCSPLFSRPPPPASPLPRIPESTRPRPPNSPLPPIPLELSSSRPNTRLSPRVTRESATPPLPPPRESHSHSTLPPPPLPHAPGRFNGSTTIEDEHSPPPPPRRSVSTSVPAREQALSPGHRAKTFGKESSPDTADEDSPPPPPRRSLSTSASSTHPKKDKTSSYEYGLDPPRNGDQSSSSESFENTPSPEHQAKSKEAPSPGHTTKSLGKESSADETLSPSHEASTSERNSSPDPTDEADTPPDPPPRTQELPSPPVTSAPPCDIVVTR